MLVLEEMLESIQASRIGDRRNVERDRVDQAQKEHEICAPSMKHIESFVSNARHDGDYVRLHRHCYHPWKQCDCHHSGSNRNRRRAKLNALPVQRLRNKAVEQRKGDRCAT